MGLRFARRRAGTGVGGDGDDRPAADPLRVYLVEDHEAVRQQVTDMLEGTGDLLVVGAAATLAEARSSLVAASPDVAILDVRLPDGSGLEFCRELRSARPEITCLMFTSHADETAMAAAALAGAAGYVMKDVAAAPRLPAVIRDVVAGKTLLDVHAALARQALEAAGDTEGSLGPLTAREDAVRLLLLQGHSNAEISRALEMSERAVRADLASLMAKTFNFPASSARTKSTSRSRRLGGWR